MTKAEVALKRKDFLEKKLEAKMKYWYGKVSEDLEDYIKFGGSYGFKLSEEREKEFEEIMDKARNDSLTAFLPDKVKNQKTANLIIDINDEYAKVIEQRDKRQRRRIYAGLYLITRKAVSQAVAENMNDADRNINKDKIAIVARNIVKDRSVVASEVIGVTETNWTAEAGRKVIAKKSDDEMIRTAQTALAKRRNDEEIDNEIEELKEIADVSSRESAGGFVEKLEKNLKSGSIMKGLALITGFGTAKKRWRTKGDKKVRPTHEGAEKQGAIPVDDYFEVGAYLMSHPGDESQGADASETMYCRCTLEYL